MTLHSEWDWGGKTLQFGLKAQISSDLCLKYWPPHIYWVRLLRITIKNSSKLTLTLQTHKPPSLPATPPAAGPQVWQLHLMGFGHFFLFWVLLSSKDPDVLLFNRRGKKGNKGYNFKTFLGLFFFDEAGKFLFKLVYKMWELRGRNPCLRTQAFFQSRNTKEKKCREKQAR